MVVMDVLGAVLVALASVLYAPVIRPSRSSGVRSRADKLVTSS
jgi:hypothetical protein